MMSQELLCFMMNKMLATNYADNNIISTTDPTHNAMLYVCKVN